MLDINPLSFIGDLYQTKKLQQWVKLFVSCLIASFVGFWGTFGSVGATILAANNSVSFALATAFFVACIVMSGSVLLTVKKSGVWKDLSIWVPPELEKQVSSTDVVSSNLIEDEKRALLG